MAEKNSDAGAALELESINFNQWMLESSMQVNADIKTSERLLAAKGQALSGGRYKKEVDIIFTSIGSVLEKAIALRQDLSARVPALLEPASLSVFKEKLERFVDGGINGVRQRSERNPMGVAVIAAIVQEAESTARIAKGRLNQRLAALPLEAKFGLQRTGESKVTTFNISNSTIANLNLGNVVGDLNASIQQLNTEGRKDLAEEVKKMTEGLGSSQDLDDLKRKDMLEHLALVAEEAAKPPEKRKLGPLRASMEALKSGVTVGTQLLTLWQGVEHALKAAGIIH